VRARQPQNSVPFPFRKLHREKGGKPVSVCLISLHFCVANPAIV
jgi:hypothetical protein